jgi:flagellar hook-associated protein 2
LAAVVDTFISRDGLIPSATASIDRSIGDLAKQYEAAAARIDAKMENYRMQFTKLDGLVAQMNSVSSYLTQQLSMLGNMSEK